jgi:hypothetical protein
VPLAVARHVDLHRPDRGDHRLGAGAVTAVRTVAAHRLVLVIAEVLAQLRLQGRLQYVLRQPGEQAVRADKLDTLGTGLLHEILGKALLIRHCTHGFDRLGHCRSFPPS